ncbi:tRNA (mo5U34)-methyltransferase [Halioglobus japonicus]|nr:tRNA (mo5U34)-methyltransferase [Halioglobus japonicus]
MSALDDKTIQDFDEQWSRYDDNDGWYASFGLFSDIVSPLMHTDDIKEKKVVDIGSGTGRIVGMLLESGASHVYAVEPAKGAFEKLKNNVASMARGKDVTPLNARGDEWTVDEPLDLAISIGVIEFISDPGPTVKRCYDALKPGGDVFFWLCSYEGNELYLKFVQPLRKLTTFLPHFMLVGIVHLLYWALCLYRLVGKVLPLPLMRYLDKIWWPMSAKKRRLVIYDQLNPTYLKYYRKHEAIALLEAAGFQNIEIHHRHGYSWSVKGKKV